MKRRFLVIALATILIAILSCGSLAFFSVQDKAENIITTGKLDIKIHQDMDSPEVIPEEGMQVMPGDVIKSALTIENSGTHPLYLRMRLEKKVNDEALSAEHCLLMNVNEEDWTYKNGYYYYNHILQPNTFTKPLFNEICIAGREVDNEYLGKFFLLDIQASAVQSENNGTSVWDAIGWKEV